MVLAGSITAKPRSTPLLSGGVIYSKSKINPLHQLFHEILLYKPHQHLCRHSTAFLVYGNGRPGTDLDQLALQLQNEVDKIASGGATLQELTRVKKVSALDSFLGPLAPWIIYNLCSVWSCEHHARCLLHEELEPPWHPSLKSTFQLEVEIASTSQ